ncbi:MAG: hypothetical protein RJQ14_12115, partial [Marinoscillum sp.]
LQIEKAQSIVSDNIIRKSSSGIKVVGTDAVPAKPTISGNQIIENSSYPLTQAGYSFPSYINNTISGNTQQAIRVYGSVNNSSSLVNELWNSPNNLPYHITDGFTIGNNFNLSIETGTVIKIQESNYTYRNVNIVVNGKLTSLGTAESPVVFTSAKDDAYAGDSNGDGNASVPAKGDWGYIKLNTNANISNVFENCLVRYGGRNIYYGDTYPMVWVVGSNSTYTDAVIEANTLEFAYGDALQIEKAQSIVSDNIIRKSSSGIKVVGTDAVPAKPTISGNQIKANSYPFYLSGYAFPDIDFNIIKENTNQAIRVSGSINGSNGEVTENWNNVQDLDMPYVIVSNDQFTVGNNMNLVIDPGVTVKLDNYARIQIDGALQIYGQTTANPVVFTSIYDDDFGGDSNGDGFASNPAAGNWGYIKFNLNPNLTNIIENVIFRYGGDSSQDYMVWINGSSSNVNQIDFLGCTFSNNFNQAVRIDGFANPTFANSNFIENGNYAIFNNTSYLINAENNYWNSNLGPTHTSNATGDGEIVTNNVDFTPWLTQEYLGEYDKQTISIAEGWSYISSNVDSRLPRIDRIFENV